MENCCGTPENREKCESLAQQIFPRLRYIATFISTDYQVQ